MLTSGSASSLARPPIRSASLGAAPSRPTVVKPSGNEPSAGRRFTDAVVSTPPLARPSFKSPAALTAAGAFVTRTADVRPVVPDVRVYTPAVNPALNDEYAVVAGGSLRGCSAWTALLIAFTISVLVVVGPDSVIVRGPSL